MRLTVNQDVVGSIPTTPAIFPPLPTILKVIIMNDIQTTQRELRARLYDLAEELSSDLARLEKAGNTNGFEYMTTVYRQSGILEAARAVGAPLETQQA